MEAEEEDHCLRLEAMEEVVEEQKHRWTEEAIEVVEEEPQKLEEVVAVEERSTVAAEVVEEDC